MLEETAQLLAQAFAVLEAILSLEKTTKEQGKKDVEEFFLKVLPEGLQMDNGKNVEQKKKFITDMYKAFLGGLAKGLVEEYKLDTDLIKNNLK